MSCSYVPGGPRCWRSWYPRPRSSPPRAAARTTGGSGSTAKPTKAQEASATKQIDINEQPLDKLKQGGTVRWAVDQFSTQWNYNQLNGPESSTSQVLYGVMPYAFIADKTAKVAPNPDYVTSAKADTSSGKQVVTIELNPKAKWSDGTPITEKDYETQWEALRGKDSKYQIASVDGLRPDLERQGGQGRARGHRDVRQAVRGLDVAVVAAVPGQVPGHGGPLQQRLPEQDPGHRGPVQGREDRQDGEDRVDGPRTRTGGAPSRTSTASSPARSRATPA